MSIVVGVDVGSTSTKLVCFDNCAIHSTIRPTGWSPRDAGMEALDELFQKTGYTRDRLNLVVGTGYGRIALKTADKTVTEITCHGRGASYLFPGADTIIDVGGQDSKVIKINSQGKVLDFLMNDKCAAGTGRFLQVMANALGLDVSELGNFQSANPVTINNMCTVFAESEVIGLLAQGTAKEAVVAGLSHAVARRIAAMVKKLGPYEKLVFTGGVALNQGVRQSLERELTKPVIVPKDCQLAGAIGAALIGRDIIEGKDCMR